MDLKINKSHLSSESLSGVTALLQEVNTALVGKYNHTNMGWSKHNVPDAKASKNLLIKLNSLI